jgi:signal peptidase I
MRGHRVPLLSLVGCLGLLCIFCAFGLIVVRIAFPAYKVFGLTMEPALYAGNLALMNPRAYRQHLPVRGDVIVFRDPGGRYLLTRLIGLPSEQIAILDGKGCLWTLCNDVSTNDRSP